MRTMREKEFSIEFEENVKKNELLEKNLNKYKLKKLLEKQTNANELLLEKNIRLSAQLRSLLQLLTKKDSQIRDSETFTKKNCKNKFGSNRVLRVLLRICRRTMAEIIKNVEFCDLVERIKEKSAGFIYFWVFDILKSKYADFFLVLKKNAKTSKILKKFGVFLKNFTKKKFFLIFCESIQNSKLKNNKYKLKLNKAFLIKEGLFLRKKQVLCCFL